MEKYFVSILVMGQPVMCGTVPALTPGDARKFWEEKFWASADDLRKHMPSLDSDDYVPCERMLALMEGTIERARRCGITIEARKSRAA